MHAIVPFSLFLLTIVTFATVALHARHSSVHLDERSWKVVLAKLQPVEVNGIGYIAQDFLDPQRNQIAVEPEIIWHMLGGEIGLNRMRDNADLLIALAAYASQWNEAEGTIVAERMRRDAVRLRSALRQIQFGMASQLITGRHWISVPFKLQEAASSYYLMRQRLLALYETSHIALLPELAQAV